ncbi:MAG: hypothetical protein ACYC99_10635 [Candidatus Geothermincolia bacterium]
MQGSFTALAKASASLFGLVLVVLVFALRSALSTLEEPEDFREYADWVSLAGIATFLYFGFCFLAAFRLLEDMTSTPELVFLGAILTVLIAAAHGGELFALHRLCNRFKECRKLGLVQACFVVALFVFSELTIWIALSGTTDATVDHRVYVAATWILFAASVRAVALVGSGFWALSQMLLSGNVKHAAAHRVEEGD